MTDASGAPLVHAIIAPVGNAAIIGYTPTVPLNSVRVNAALPLLSTTARPYTILRVPLPDSSQVTSSDPLAATSSCGWFACPPVGILVRGENTRPSVDTA